MKPDDLDDPTPIEPDDSLLERVHARSGTFRRRRRTQRWVSIGSVALIVVLAVGIGIVVGSDDAAEPSGPSASTSTTQPGVSTRDLEGEWRPVSIAGYSGALTSPPLSDVPLLRFRANDELVGTDGCNGFSGPFELHADGTWEADQIMSELKRCPGTPPLQPALREAAGLEQHDDRLILRGPDGGELVTLVRPTVTARIELPSHTMTAGSTMQGRLIVDNETGRAIPAQGCGSLFRVALSNADYQPELLWTTCFQHLDIPTGVSRYPIEVSASDSRGGSSGPLKPGTYEATLYQSTHVVPDPSAVIITVVAASDTAEFSADDLEAGLVSAGSRVTPEGTSPGHHLQTDAARFCVDGTQLLVYEYRDEAARLTVSDGISSDGSGIVEGNRHTIVEWIGPPHFYARGRIIALVLRDDTALLESLRGIMGPTITPDAHRGVRKDTACGQG